MENIEERINKKIKEKLINLANELTDEIKQNIKTQFKTNKHLLESIQITSKKEANSFEFFISSNAPYAKYLEFGTSKTSAKPFMKPAFEKIKSKFYRDFS